jgi:hypothetical protein
MHIGGLCVIALARFGLGSLAARNGSAGFKETLNKSGPALLVDLNLIRETTSHDFPA